MTEKHVLVGFSYDPSSWISRLIARVTFGKSHVVIISPCGGYFIESSGRKALGHPTGVRMRRIDEFYAEPEFVIKRIAHPDPDGMWALAKRQLGKGYDWSWIVGFLLRDPRIQERDKFTCSELVAWCFDNSGGTLFPDGRRHWWHVTPYEIEMVAKDF